MCDQKMVLPEFVHNSDIYMNFENIFTIAFAAFVALSLGSTIFSVLFKNAAPIKGTIGEVVLKKSAFTNNTIKIQLLDESAPDKAIGLVIITKGFGLYDMETIPLSIVQAKELFSLLETAISRGASRVAS
jgi:hypothetical protein